MDETAKEYKLKDIFDLVDTDRRGYIAVDHFAKLAAEHFGSNHGQQEKISEIIRVLDPEEKGVIHFEQFCDGVQQVRQLQVAPAGEGSESELGAAELLASGCDCTRPHSIKACGDAEDSVETAAKSCSDVWENDSNDLESINTSDIICRGPGERLKRPTMLTNDTVDIHLDDSGSEASSFSDPPRLLPSPRLRTPTPRSRQASPISSQLLTPKLTPSAIASQLYRSSSSLGEPTRRGSAADLVLEDIDGGLGDLNGKVDALQNQLQQLVEIRESDTERHSRLKDENGYLIERVHLLEEELRDMESRSLDQLAEERRKNRELMQRIEKDKTIEIEVLSQSLHHMESECEAFREALPLLKAENERLKKEGSHLTLEIDRTQRQFSELTAEHERLQQRMQEDQVKMVKERQVHAQLIDELSRELDELRTLKSESMSNSTSNSTSNLIRDQQMQMENLIVHLKEENAMLREQACDLQDQLMSLQDREIQQLLLRRSNNVDPLVENLTVEQLREMMREEQESNSKLRDYIEHMTLRILENKPSLLEVASKTE